jgi:large subunit ribosomal protein L25
MGGGLLDHALREVELDCLPGAIPDSIDVDVTALEIGDSVHVGDLVLPEGVELKTDAAQSVASVVTPKAEEEPEAVAVEGEEGIEGEAPEPGAEGEAPPEEEADKSKD